MAGFRLHPVDDLDIIQDLARFNNRTQRIKEAYRKAMQVERVLPVPTAEAPKEWMIPAEPSVKKTPKQGSIKANILFKNKF